jgi:hypothetical protein
MKEKDERWCEVEVTLENGRLSICGSEGEIIGKAEGRRRALEYWENFFEDEKGQLGDMQQRFLETCLHTPQQGAQFVVKTDGEFHGLDIHKENGTRLYLTESCGQITKTLGKWFPEVAPYLKWHLNDMKAGCEHQEALGWGNEHMSQPCPECGYKYGTAWLKRALPPEVIRWVRTF